MGKRMQAFGFISHVCDDHGFEDGCVFSVFSVFSVCVCVCGPGRPTQHGNTMPACLLV